ncbi:hypothetical protein [Marinobacter sp. C18]|uniref:hypothetical protein n=1 Tax=Marinobacter sp. C18 TaxID=1772288 RepID=UPI002116407F|nr:hypothetical protein [Marinobacter sp. C18]
MSDWAAKQIEQALASDQGKRGSGQRSGVPAKKASPAKRLVSGESPGEGSVRLALMAAFGDWFKGGEVVPELRPFSTRKFRADFALPRYRFAVEVDGWSHHGEFLGDHEADRARGLVFSSHDWLPFRVSHGQAINNPGMLIDAIASAMKYRLPIARESIDLEPIEHKHGVWYQLVYQ